MSSIKGNRVEIRPLKLQDVYEMQRWGKHTNPLFYDYNFPDLNEYELREWYRSKTFRRSKLCFGVLNEENRLIGYLTIKDIRIFRRTAKLGIVFDPSNIDKGYGTETINTLLNYFFNEMKMRAMYLDVARHNTRAIRCYEKCGFRVVREYTERLEDQSLPIFTDDSFKETRVHFSSFGNKIYQHFYEMKIDRENYN